MFKTRLLFLFIATGLAFSSCKKDDPPLPANTVNFQSANLGFDDNETEKVVTIVLSRAEVQEVTFGVQITESGAAYGSEYTTDPAATNGTIQVTIPAGSATGSFKVLKKDNAFFTGEEELTFTLASVPAPLISGNTTTATVKFASIVSDGQTMILDGGGSTYPNMVFVNFATNTQTAVQRDTWDLALSNADDNHVLLNSSMQMVAYPIEGTDIDAVGQTQFDAEEVSSKAIVGNAAEAAVAAGFFPKKYVDNPINPFTKGTAIASVSSNNDNNKVYFVGIYTAVGAPAFTPIEPTWLKVRITSTASGYQVDYADYNATTHKTLQVDKGSNGLFTYVSLHSDGIVSVAPTGDNWDIYWGAGVNVIPDLTDSIPYGFQDLIYTNIYNGVKAAQVMEEDVSYDAFSELNISSVSFNDDDRLTIGSGWRITAPGGTTGILRDRYYVIQDAFGNVYKLRFLLAGINDTGTRGKPEIEYKLVKKG